MGVAWRAAVVLVVFAAVAWLASHAVMLHEVRRGAVGAEVKLASWMAGLFGGGLAAVLVGLALVIKRGR